MMTVGGLYLFAGVIGLVASIPFAARARRWREIAKSFQHLAMTLEARVNLHDDAIQFALRQKDPGEFLTMLTETPRLCVRAYPEWKQVCMDRAARQSVEADWRS